MVKIISDSTCDLSPELVERYGITILPLHILLGEEEYEDGKSITPEEIFRWSDEHETTPKTSAPSMETTMELLRPYVENGDECVCFCISESMSTSGNVIRMAAEELEAARRAVRDHLRATGDTYDPIEEPVEEDGDYVLPRPLHKGDRVRLVTVNKEGELTDEPKNGMVTFQAGVLRVRARVADLRLLTDADVKKKEKQPKSTVTVERSGGFRNEIDLRGMMGDEACLAVDQYLDEAVMNGCESVRLIHGKGTGALRTAIWKYLRGDRRIASFRIGRYGEGDGGVTVVELK